MRCRSVVAAVAVGLAVVCALAGRAEAHAWPDNRTRSDAEFPFVDLAGNETYPCGFVQTYDADNYISVNAGDLIRISWNRRGHAGGSVYLHLAPLPMSGDTPTWADFEADPSTPATSFILAEATKLIPVSTPTGRYVLQWRWNDDFYYMSCIDMMVTGTDSMPTSDPSIFANVTETLDPRIEALDTTRSAVILFSILGGAVCFFCLAGALFAVAIVKGWFCCSCCFSDKKGRKGDYEKQPSEFDSRDRTPPGSPGTAEPSYAPPSSHAPPPPMRSGGADTFSNPAFAGGGPPARHVPDMPPPPPPTQFAL